MRRLPLLAASVGLALVASACGGSDSGGSSATQPGASSPGTTAPTAPGGATGAVDPTAGGSCSVLSTEQMATIFGSVVNPVPVFDLPEESTDCQWSADDGRQIGYKITFFTPPDTWLVRTGTPVAVADEAYVSGEGATLALEADVNGWLVDIWTPGNDSGAVTADDLTALAALLDSVLVPNPNDISPGGTGGGSVDPGTGSGGGSAFPGELTAMDITIDAPAYLAGSTSVGPDAVAGNFDYRCNLSGFLEVSFAPGAALPGLPVESMSVTGDDVDAAPGTYPVQFNLLARVQPPNTSFPFVEFFATPGEVTLAGDGSFTFTISDDGFGNPISGSVRCTFAA